jgi:protein AbiQ
MRLVLLSDAFYSVYGKCEQILQKPSRPYLCAEVNVNGQIYAVPFRHHIPHKYAFFTCEGYGLDYTKTVVIRDRRFLSNKAPQIEQAEFEALKGNEQRICNGVKRFVALYKKALRYKGSPHYKNILQYSALQYFEDYI